MAKPGRKPRFTDAEAFDVLTSSGLDVLLDSGFSLGAEAVKLEPIIHQLGVPRGQAYRVLTTPSVRPQERLRQEVLVKFLTETPGFGLTQTRSASIGLASSISNVASREDRSAAMRSAMRIASASSDSLVTSKRWQMYRAAVAAIRSQQDPDPVLLAAIDEGESRAVQQYVNYFEELAPYFRLKLRPALSMHQFAMIASALSDGLRTGQQPTSSTITVQSDGTPETWSLFDFALDALVTQLFEPY